MSNVQPTNDGMHRKPSDEPRGQVSERLGNETRWTVLRYALEGRGPALRLGFILCLLTLLTFFTHVWM